VINGILLLIFADNLAVLKWRAVFTKHQALFYYLIFLSILLSYFCPADQIFATMPGVAAELVLTLITLAPLGFAGIIFPVALAENKSPSLALAFNLFGSVIGGLLEYASTFLGIKSLELIGLSLYLLSFFARRPW
jgi:hypothetical protein